MPITEYWNPTHVTFGRARLETLTDLAAQVGKRRVLLVAGEDLLDALEVRARIEALLSAHEVACWERVTPIPEIMDAQATVDFARERHTEAVIGIGGGSTLDTAKIVAAALPNGGEVLSLVSKERPLVAVSLPAILIPTTAGTGSEVTRWGTLWERVDKKKHSLEGPGMFPTHALVDPALTHPLPPEQTAATGMDALSHAMESFWNKNANPVSDCFALRAVALVCRHLPTAVAEPNDTPARDGMMLASLFAGLAFSNTKTAAAHSLSYPMTLHCGVVHGQATSITLPALLRFNAGEYPERMLVLARATGAESVDEGADRITALLERVGLKTRLSELGIGEAEREVILREGFTPDRVGHNLRDLTPDGMREILQRCQ